MSLTTSQQLIKNLHYRKKKYDCCNFCKYEICVLVKFEVFLRYQFLFRKKRKRGGHCCICDECNHCNHHACRQLNHP